MQTSVDHARRATLRLQLPHNWPDSPDVLLVSSRPGIGRFAHGRRRSNRINGDHFVCLISNVGGCFVAVDAYRSTHWFGSPSLQSFSPQRSPKSSNVFSAD